MESVFVAVRFLHQSEAGTKGPVHDLQCLLCDIGVESLVILVLLRVVVIRLVAETLSLLQRILPDMVQADIVQILG